ncbi:dTMP kinase [Thermophilibacter sp.]
MRGIFITLEGADGCGKSTQAGPLADALAAGGREVVRLREPGGTPISEKVRALLLDPANAGMAAECELMLYEASRAQLVREVIEPALARGAAVLCDRFYDSTYAYQAGGRGLPDELVRRANALGSCGLAPDRTLVLDLDPELAYARATAGGADRMEAEGLAFQRRVRDAYLRLAAEEPDRVRVVDASGERDEVAVRLRAAVADLGATR